VVRPIAFAVPGSLETPTGGYAYDRRIIRELGQLGWQIDFADLGDGFPWPTESAHLAAQARLLAIPAGRTIVVDGLALGVLPEAASQLAGRNPLLALVHHPLALEAGISVEQASSLHESERSALAAVQHVVVTSASTALLVARNYGVPSDRITVVRPGTDPVRFAQGSQDTVVRLLSVGAVTPRKGYDVLIAALATLTDLPWRLTIAGDRTRDGAAVARLDADIAHHALADRIATPGAVSPSRLAEFYGDADVFALASHFEGYGMAYADAVAHGLPVVGTDGGAIPDTVPADASLLVAPGNIAAFARALRLVISDADARRKLAGAARVAAPRLPTWRQSAEIFAHTLETLA
jgi:glycosyltransferase involved in cell wall biosynthesis